MIKGGNIVSFYNGQQTRTCVLRDSSSHSLRFVKSQLIHFNNTVVVIVTNNMDWNSSLHGEMRQFSKCCQNASFRKIFELN